MKKKSLIDFLRPVLLTLTIGAAFCNCGSGNLDLDGSGDGSDQSTAISTYAVESVPKPTGLWDGQRIPITTFDAPSGLSNVTGFSMQTFSPERSDSFLVWGRDIGGSGCSGGLYSNTDAIWKKIPSNSSKPARFCQKSCLTSKGLFSCSDDSCSVFDFNDFAWKDLPADPVREDVLSRSLEVAIACKGDKIAMIGSAIGADGKKQPVGIQTIGPDMAWTALNMTGNPLVGSSDRLQFSASGLLYWWDEMNGAIGGIRILKADATWKSVPPPVSMAPESRMSLVPLGDSFLATFAKVGKGGIHQQTGQFRYDFSKESWWLLSGSVPAALSATTLVVSDTETYEWGGIRAFNAADSSSLSTKSGCAKSGFAFRSDLSKNLIFDDSNGDCRLNPAMAVLGSKWLVIWGGCSVTDDGMCKQWLDRDGFLIALPSAP